MFIKAVSDRKLIVYQNQNRWQTVHGLIEIYAEACGVKAVGRPHGCCPPKGRSARSAPSLVAAPASYSSGTPEMW